MTRPPPLQLDAKHDLRVPVGVGKWPFFVLNSGVSEMSFEGSKGGKRAYLHAKAKDETIGLATVADIDVIAWATSAYTKILNSNRELPRTLQLRPADFLRFCRRPTGGRQHHLLDASLQRLTNTSVSTNFSSDGTLRPFEWIEFMERPSRGRASYELHFGGWLQEAVEGRQIIKIAPDLLRFRGLQRRLYLWCCAYAKKGSYERYTLALADAYRRSGSQTPIRKFIYELRGCVEAQGMPGFALSFEPNGDGENLVLTRTNEGTTDIFPLPLPSPSPCVEREDMQLPPNFFEGMIESPAGAPENPTFHLEEHPAAPEPLQPPPFILDPEPSEPVSRPPEPVAAPPTPARTSTPSTPPRRSVNTPLQDGRTGRNVYF